MSGHRSILKSNQPTTPFLVSHREKKVWHSVKRVLCFYCFEASPWLGCFEPASRVRRRRARADRRWVNLELVQRAPWRAMRITATVQTIFVTEAEEINLIESSRREAPCRRRRGRGDASRLLIRFPEGRFRMLGRSYRQNALSDTSVHIFFLLRILSCVPPIGREGLYYGPDDVPPWLNLKHVWEAHVIFCLHCTVVRFRISNTYCGSPFVAAWTNSRVTHLTDNSTKV